MDRCWLQGALGDALHALSCAAGYNIRWLLRAIVRLGLGALFCALSALISYAVAALNRLAAGPGAAVSASRLRQPAALAFTPPAIGGAG